MNPELDYVLGPMTELVQLGVPPIGPIDPVPPPVLARLFPTISSWDETGIVLVFPSYDSSLFVAPVEARAFWVPDGTAQPTDGEGYMASGLPNAAAVVAVPADGLESVTLATPSEAIPAEGQPQVKCRVQTVFGFKKPS